MQRLTCLVTLALACALGRASSGGEERPDAPRLFKKLDTNGDGKLAREEIPAERQFFYDRLLKTSDADGDGTITQQEFSEGFPRRGRGPRADRPAGERGTRRVRPAQGRTGLAQGARYFKRLDRNQDGKITREEIGEMPEPRRARFARMIADGDQDGDGALSRKELLGVLAASARERAPQERLRARRRQGGPGGKLFALLDADRDGKLTKAELRRAPKLVSRFDVDGDQALSLREILAASPSSAVQPDRGDTAARKARKARTAEERKAKKKAESAKKKRKAREKAEKEGAPPEAKEGTTRETAVEGAKLKKL